MKKIFQIGSNYPLQVINVSPEKGYVDLSKKHVTESESKLCEIKFKESKIADNIVKRTAELCSLPKVVIYQQYIWPLLSIKGEAKEPEKRFDDIQNEIKSEVAVDNEHDDDKSDEERDENSDEDQAR